MTIPWKKLSHISLCCLFLLFSLSNHATTVLRIDLNQLLQQAEFVFEGEVITSQAQWNENRTSIITLIQFRIDDVIKGNFEDQTIELQFQGGSVDGMTLQISDMHYPEIGDKGIYFVEQLSHNQVNPLLGWSQGHFRILQDHEGQERIFSEDKRPVRSVIPGSQTQLQRNNQTEIQLSPFSDGVVSGINLGNQSSDRSIGMDKQSFKQTLQQRLQELRQFDVE